MEVKSFTIDSDQYSSILDLVLDSEAKIMPKNLNFSCMIACKVNFISNVQIFDINNLKDIRYISYVHNHGTLYVDISDDM
jgi:hypothetical protein